MHVIAVGLLRRVCAVGRLKVGRVKGEKCLRGVLKGGEVMTWWIGGLWTGDWRVVSW